MRTQKSFKSNEFHDEFVELFYVHRLGQRSCDATLFELHLSDEEPSLFKTEFSSKSDHFKRLNDFINKNLANLRLFSVIFNSVTCCHK